MLQFFHFFPSLVFFAITCGLLRIGRVREGVCMCVCGRCGMCYASSHTRMCWQHLCNGKFVRIVRATHSANGEREQESVRVLLLPRLLPQNFGVLLSTSWRAIQNSSKFAKQFANLQQIRVNTHMTADSSDSCEIDKDRQHGRMWRAGERLGSAHL